MTKKIFQLTSLALLLAYLPQATLAQTSSLIFERASIRIDAAPVKNADAITVSHEPITLNIEVRPEDSLKLEYIHTLNTLTEGGGVMIVLDSPATLPLPALKVYTPVDVAFVADDGTIVQISPHVVLAEMAQPVQAKTPIKALLFLKNGSAAARAIRPRDTIAGKMFSPAPATL